MSLQRLTLTTWNVNSIKARLSHTVEYAKNHHPDILLLQEIKCPDENFPLMEFEDLGYNCLIHGQKSYNGVAILSKLPMEETARGLPQLPFDETAPQARYLEAEISLPPQKQTEKAPPIGALRVASIYLPNGGEIDSDKFRYKMQFFDALKNHAEDLAKLDIPVALGGDYNVAPADIDVHDPKGLRGTTCFHPEEQKRFRRILNSGFADAWRVQHPEEQSFSWWDYRGGGWQHNKGLRIDFMLCNAMAMDACHETVIHADERGREKASDHAPVSITLEF